MRRPCNTLLASLMVSCAAAAVPAQAQDVLDDIARKADMDNQDRARVATEISDRREALSQTKGDAKLRKAARSKLLKPVQAEGATEKFKAFYAEECGSALEAVIDGDDRLAALDAVLVLKAMQHPAAIDAILRGLRSTHVAVRYSAADTIASMHKALAGDAGACRRVLVALSGAGAAESDLIVLRVIYKAAYFQADVPDFKHGADAAAALRTILDGRAGRLNQGGRDEATDALGCEAAAACFKAAAAADQQAILRNVAAILEQQVNTYFDRDTAKESLPAIKIHIQKQEDAIHRMLGVLRRSPPDEKISRHLPAKRSSQSMKSAFQALEQLKRVIG